MPKGVDTGGHPGRQVGRGRWAPNEDIAPPHPVADEEPDYEPDYEAIMERRAERHRPDWA